MYVSESVGDVNELFDSLASLIGKEELRQGIEHVYEMSYG